MVDAKGFVTVYILFVTLFFSCQHKKQVTNLDSDTVLEEKAVLSLQLDSVTVFSQSSCGITVTKKGEVLSLVNLYDKSIKIFDLSNSLQNRTIYLEEKGINGIGKISSILSHLYINEDSIFIYNPWANRTLFLINSKSKILFKKKLSDGGNNLPSLPVPIPSQSRPILKVRNKLYFTCGFPPFLREKKSDYPMVLEFDIANSKSRYIFPLSEKYDKGFWGDIYKYQPAFTYNNSASKFVLSFNIDENLYFGDEQTGKISLIDKDATSKFIKTPQPMYADVSYEFSKELDYNKIGTFSLSASDYSKIFYDPYQSVYYRIVYIRPSKEEVRKGKRRSSFSIIVFDSKFNKIGEQFFDTRKYIGAMIFISKKGLLIARKDLYDENEDELSFSAFKVKKNEKK